MGGSGERTGNGAPLGRRWLSDGLERESWVSATGMEDRGLGAETFSALGWLDSWLVTCRVRGSQNSEKDRFHLFPSVNSEAGYFVTSIALGICTLAVTSDSGWASGIPKQPVTKWKSLSVVTLSQITNCATLFFLHWIAFVVLIAFTEM